MTNSRKCDPCLQCSMKDSCNMRFWMKSMILYFERHGAKLFLRGKPIRFGYKVWCLCDRLEYLIQCEPYQGASGTYNKELGVGASVVLDSVSKLPDGVPFKIYGDRFFLLSN